MSDYNGAEIMMQYAQQFRENKKEDEAKRSEAALRKIEQIQSQDWYKGADAKQGVFDTLLANLGVKTKDTKSVLANNDIKKLETIAYGNEGNPENVNFDNITGRQSNRDWLTKLIAGNEDKTTKEYNNARWYR